MFHLFCPRLWVYQLLRAVFVQTERSTGANGTARSRCIPFHPCTKLSQLICSLTAFQDCSPWCITSPSISSS